MRRVLNLQEPASLPLHNMLKLKVGCRVILLRNLDLPRFCNGIRLRYWKYLRSKPRLLQGISEIDTVNSRIPLILSDLPITFKRLHLHVRSAFAVTINKFQDNTKVVGIERWLENDVFSHGQLYVALSKLIICYLEAAIRLYFEGPTTYVDSKPWGVYSGIL